MYRWFGRNWTRLSLFGTTSWLARAATRSDASHQIASLASFVLGEDAMCAVGGLLATCVRLNAWPLSRHFRSPVWTKVIPSDCHLWNHSVCLESGRVL